MHSLFTFGENSSDEFGVIAVYFENLKYQGLYSGQSTNLETEKSGKSIEWEIISQDYDKPMEFTFGLINEDASPISQEQQRALSKWLCKRGIYNWLFIQDEYYSDIWLYCNIHNPQVWAVNDTVGMQFTVTTSSAVAFSEEHEYYFSLTNDSKTINDLFIVNDEEIAIPPSIEITIEETGNLEISNDQEIDTGYKTIIKNVVAGEIITITYDGQIQSSNSAHDIINDSNLKWLRFYDGNNVLTFNLKCSGVIRYREYRKLVVF
ncbi:phage tail domain-containing protein [Clostridium sp. HBUAS56010]|uniref:phage tail domain-containing protein n=1 Tax=Clostridium sp. HBUAS56010 TaxID=2571127 RepID=UPI0011786329|nr:phage tail domain-containing protein [Clostridium sp. HBUAS56010]